MNKSYLLIWDSDKIKYFHLDKEIKSDDDGTQVGFKCNHNHKDAEHSFIKDVRVGSDP